MDRYICIHAHFYQPPRENPWLEAVEAQDSADPYHDWNERVTAESYAPNSASRILDPDGRIVRIVNNYARISFNFGPTLLSWMEERSPNLYQRILEADRESRELFSGHGSALAQVYNHMILPLANRRDKETQVIWGLRDFERRFGREAEGMWLAETAADTETLEVLAANGIQFTILAPHQAGQVRRLRRRGVWRDVEGGRIDPTRVYACKLPSGRSIALFFYDGPISRSVAFEKLLSNGEQFAQRLLGGFNDTRRWPQLMHIATDGETYGHHHRHGEMALAYALHYIESNQLAKITNYGEYLQKYPPGVEVGIIERTSWSCAHGIERWRSNCGCNSGGNSGWNQNWREPLRNALDWLRDAIAEPFAAKLAEFFPDPWQARNRYISVVLDRDPANVQRFFDEDKSASHPLSHAEQVTALQLLEMQRHAMLMFTSCGWFFDELSGIETVQVMQYAGRVIQLAQEALGLDLEASFLERLAQARSNLPEMGNGADIYNRSVKPAMVNLLSVAAHYAVSSLFHGDGGQHAIYCYAVDVKDYTQQESGLAKLALGNAVVSSQITRESLHASFGVLHFGDHNVSAAVREFQGPDLYAATVREVSQPFVFADLPNTLRLLDKHFGGTSYSLASLFRDEQRRIVNGILASITKEADSSFHQLYEHHAPILRFLAATNANLPQVLRLTAEFVLNSELRRTFAEEVIEPARVHALLEAAARDRITLDAAGLAYALKRRLKDAALALEASPGDLETVERLATLARLAALLPFEVDLWRAQNAYYHAMQTVLPEMMRSHSAQAREWLKPFLALGEALHVKVSVPERAGDVPIAAD